MKARVYNLFHLVQKSIVKHTTFTETMFLKRNMCGALNNNFDKKAGRRDESAAQRACCSSTGPRFGF